MKSYTLKKQGITQISENKFRCFLILQEKNNKGTKIKKVTKETTTVDHAITFIETTLNKHGLLMLWS